MLMLRVFETGPRREASQQTKRLKTNFEVTSEHEDHTPGRNEMDTRADTCSGGSNFRLLATTGQVCK